MLVCRLSLCGVFVAKVRLFLLVLEFCIYLYSSRTFIQPRPALSNFAPRASAAASSAVPAPILPVEPVVHQEAHPQILSVSCRAILLALLWVLAVYTAQYFILSRVMLTYFYYVFERVNYFCFSAF